MQLKPDPTTTPANFPSAVAVAALCANCGADERRLLHHVRQRNTLRRLCTTCVLRLHPQSFCPTCFQVYPQPPSNDPVFTCFKCYSASHPHCVSAAPTHPPTPYTCPLCLYPNTPIFKLKEVQVESGEGYKVMDRDAAKKLLAAAKIASASMNKAVVIARAEAEKRAKEAAFTRKRAKEALDYVAYLMMKEKVKKEKDALMTVGNNGGYTVNVSTSINRNANVSVVGSLGSSVSIEEKVNNDGNADSSNRVLAALSAVELRENEGLGMALDDFCDEKGDDHVVFGDSQSAEENLDVQGESGGDVSDGVDSVQTVEDHVTYEENGNIEEQLGNGSPQRC